MSAVSSFFLFLVFSTTLVQTSISQQESPPLCDIEMLQFALNLEYLKAEFFLYGALGYGLDTVAPRLTGGGSSPIGAEKANLQWFIRDIIIQFAYQDVGHISAIQDMVGRFPRPLMDLSAQRFAQWMDNAIGKPLQPPFNPYLNDINFLLGSYLLPYISLTYYVGANAYLNNTKARQLLAGIMAVEAGQDAVIRTLLYERALHPLYPYGLNVAEITDRLSTLRDLLGRTNSNKDDGIIGRLRGRREGLTRGNIINANSNYVAFSRTPLEILSILYGTGSEIRAGGFFPVGANGTIAHAYLNGADSSNFACGIPPYGGIL
ncbi:hypothetical protein GIB67_038337 [Kingdonia uniflora]|uniref:Desiccation-related protein PCC13-62 n=1 Tax=Kingdonia uniflora TaxID=39325 RepID=A0A7J7KUL5_9MAGN|nr:hypothetical protein GIB67_038337 [Kingdonia uniflora]